MKLFLLAITSIVAVVSLKSVQDWIYIRDLISIKCKKCAFSLFSRTVMKSGPEIVKAGLRQFFESAADDIEKMVENLKLGKVSSRNQVSVWSLHLFRLFLQSCTIYRQYLWIPVG